MNRLYMITESILLNFIFWSILYQAECHAAILAQNQGKTEVDFKCCRPLYLNYVALIFKGLRVLNLQNSIPPIRILFYLWAAPIESVKKRSEAPLFESKVVGRIGRSLWRCMTPI